MYNNLPFHLGGANGDQTKKNIMIATSLILLSNLVVAAPLEIVRIEKEIEVKEPDLAFNCTFVKAPSYVWTTAKLNSYFIPEDISANFRSPLGPGFTWSAPAGTPCGPIEKAVQANRRQNNGKLLVKAIRHVTLDSMPYTSGSATCKLYLNERVYLQLGDFEFRNHKVTFIRDLEGITLSQCRQHTPTGI